MITNLKEKFQNVYEQITYACNKVERNPNEVKLVSVTKTWPVHIVQSVLDINELNIGENRVQEIVQKTPLLKGNKIIHMIGHLQTNKVAKVVPLVDWIHSIDSEKLLNKVDQCCRENNKKINILIQVNTSKEDSKSGCSPEKAYMLCEKATQCDSVNFKGLMCIGPLTNNEKEIRNSFINLKKIGERVKNLSNHSIELSMGMSSDYKIAIEEGSTIVRIGSLIFGNRVY